MKKIIIAIALIGLLLTGCKNYNKAIFDTSYRFNYAIIKLPNGEFIKTKITKWSDGGENDFGWIQVWTEDNYYYTALENVVLSNKEIK